MPKQYRTREGEATAVDTKTQLTTLGSEAAPGPLMVPAKATKLIGILAVAIENFAAAGSASALVRLEGPGLPGGPEVVGVNATGYNIVTGGQQAICAEWFPLDVPVTPTQEILIFGEMCGVDIGQISFGVTLVFAA